MAVDTSPGPGRVLIAETAGPLVAEPTWTRYDNITLCRNYGFDSYAGRQTELDTTDTGHATVYFQDQNKTLTPDLVGCQIMLQLYNPVTAAWQPRWRGHIDDLHRDLINVPNAPLANSSLTAVGIFDYLGGVHFLPTIMGDPIPSTAKLSGVVFYDNENVDDRFFALLDDANIAATMMVIFSGHVELNETLYDPDDVILQACRDAADAEFPGVANFFEDRFGRCCFHGRLARFDPLGTEAGGANWDFKQFAAGTREDSGAAAAEVKDFSYNAPRARIINSYVAWPSMDENGKEFNRDKIQDMVKTDAASITQYGYRGDEAGDLIIKRNYDNNNPGPAECELYAQFYVDNYSAIRKAVESVLFQSCPPGDTRAPEVWRLMTEGDISDEISLTIDEADLAAEPFFIDGINIECRPLNPQYDLVNFTPNLTPASYYGTNVFEP
jgi:hypothetical protein